MNVFLIILVCLLTCGGQLCQKKAVQDWQEESVSILDKLLNPWLVAAIFLMGLGLLAWLFILPSVPLNIAYPMLSLNFVFITLAARFWFHEPTHLRHWLGVASIMFGVLLIGTHL